MSMKKIDLEMMSVDDLWSLHEEVSRILSSRITSEKRELEKRLAVLNRGRRVIEGGDAVQSYNANGEARRKYPKVFPKYRNPQTPHETWSGRGKQPRWLAAAIKTGRKMEDFVISEAGGSKSRRQRK
ncbi:MAG: H-NS histone family protein [Alphaproteobacteria bacterium]|nr:MAG: H-NS histone family protein [Alphaproteobacteria bacterium]